MPLSFMEGQAHGCDMMPMARVKHKSPGFACMVGGLKPLRQAQALSIDSQKRHSLCMDSVGNGRSSFAHHGPSCCVV